MPGKSDFATEITQILAGYRPVIGCADDEKTIIHYITHFVALNVIAAGCVASVYGGLQRHMGMAIAPCFGSATLEIAQEIGKALLRDEAGTAAHDWDDPHWRLSLGVLKIIEQYHRSKPVIFQPNGAIALATKIKQAITELYADYCIADDTSPEQAAFTIGKHLASEGGAIYEFQAMTEFLAGTSIADFLQRHALTHQQKNFGYAWDWFACHGGATGVETEHFADALKVLNLIPAQYYPDIKNGFKDHLEKLENFYQLCAEVVMPEAMQKLTA